MPPFTAPSWVPQLPPIPDSVSVPDFIFNDDYRFCPTSKAPNPFTCGMTGKTYTNAQTKERVELLARGLGKEMGWSPNKGTEWDKVAAVFAVNTVSPCKPKSDGS